MLYININVILPDHYCFPLPVLVTGKLENCILMKSCLLIHLGGNSPGVTGKITGCLPPPITRLNSHWQTFPKSVDTSRYRVIFLTGTPLKITSMGKMTGGSSFLATASPNGSYQSILGFNAAYIQIW